MNNHLFSITEGPNEQDQLILIPPNTFNKGECKGCQLLEGQGCSGLCNGVITILVPQLLSTLVRNEVITLTQKKSKPACNCLLYLPLSEIIASLQTIPVTYISV